MRIESIKRPRQPTTEQVQALILERLKRGDRVRMVAEAFNLGEAAIRTLAKREGLKLVPNRNGLGEGYSTKQYRTLKVEIPEQIYFALTLAARRRDASAVQLAIGILGGVLLGGNVESTLGRNGGYSFMRVRAPAEREYHRQYKKARAAEAAAAAAAGMKSP
jgi:hypothetical protein